MSPQGGDVFFHLIKHRPRCSRDELTCGFIVVHADPVQLQVAVSVVGACRVDAVLVADHLPELNKGEGGQAVIARTNTESIHMSVFYTFNELNDVKRAQY